jgi:two-component system NarL family response regulator
MRRQSSLGLAEVRDMTTVTSPDDFTFSRPPIIHVAVQDRRRLFRDGVALVLGAEPDMIVCGTATTAQELVALSDKCRLDVVVLELDTQDWDPCRLVAALRKRHPGLRVIGTGESEHRSLRSYQAGVRSVFPRSGGVRTLLDTVRSLPPVRPTPAPRQVVRIDERRALLTPRERQVLQAIASGVTTRGLAHSMGISPKTVENYKQRIFSKLGVQNQAHAVAVALRRGLLSAPAMTAPAPA